VANIILNRLNHTKQYVISILLILLVATACFFLSGFIGYKVVALLLLVTVSLIAMFFDIWPVVVAAILSALVWDFFFIPPQFTFHVNDAEDALMLLMYFFIAMVNATLTYKIRQTEKITQKREEKENTLKLYNTLLNSLSHELRTPISTIIAATDNLQSGNSNISEEHKSELVQEISEASLRLNRQVENLLNMSRLESGFIQPKRDWCDVNELIHSSLNRMPESLKNHKVEVRIKENLPLFSLDFVLMEQVLCNLMRNAALYSPENSTIVCEAFHTEEISNKGNAVEKITGRLVITISDNGPGFPVHETKKVFEKFYRLKNSKAEGTGLGLSIVKGFVEAHGGVIKLENNASGGAKFTVEIPSEMTFIQLSEK
jgi:two-component system sensor histidine kinase KdpD